MAKSLIPSSQPDACPSRQPGERLELNIQSNPANLRQVRNAIEEFAHAAGLKQQQCDEIGLVVNEAVANVIRHGYGGATNRPIAITAQRVAG